MKSYIKCVNVDFESSRLEDFYGNSMNRAMLPCILRLTNFIETDVQLNVKGCKDLTASFENYIEEEMMDGENKYQAEGHGLQDAKKGVIFTRFPPVLHLQLKRFEYDWMRDTMVKINDRHEFPPVIELDKFLDESAATDGTTKPVKQTYHLHGVLVHSGDVHGGHYLAFIKPGLNGKWYGTIFSSFMDNY